jgi:CheY-like chemotaxis protein
MHESRRILICEDNPAMGELLRFTMKHEGLDVTLARTGTEALRRIESERFDVVITDYQMPGATGEDVCRSIRSRAEYDDVSVVMYTAKGFELSAEELRAKYRIARLINKPFSPRAMVRLVHALLDGRPVPALAYGALDEAV